MNDGDKIVSKLNNLQVGGFTQNVKIAGSTIGVTSASYTSGVTLGAGNPIKVELSRTQTGSGVLQSIVVQDLSKQDGAIDVVVFDSLPTATIFTNNSALDIGDADLTKVIGVVSIVAGDYDDFADNSVATKFNIGLVLKSLNTPQNFFYVALVSRDTKTYVANEVSICLGILQD